MQLCRYKYNIIVCEIAKCEQHTDNKVIYISINTVENFEIWLKLYIS